MRPHSHQVGDKALAQFSEVLASRGWVLQRIDKNSDYGEDLFAQIAYLNDLIPYKFYFQVKGTETIDKLDSGTHWTVGGLKKSTVERWLETTDATVLVLWNVSLREGYFGFAKTMLIKSWTCQPR